MPVGAASATSGGGSPAAAACSASSATIRATVVVLPVPGSAGDDGEAAQHGGRGGQALAAVVGLAGEQAREAVGEHGFVDGRGRAVAERAQVGGDLALLAPVAVEVQRAADEAQRAGGVGFGVLADGDERARREPRDPRLGLRPRQRRQVDRLVGVDRRGGADRGEVDEDVAEARAADGERGGERDPARPARRRATSAAPRRGRRRPTARRRR